MIETGIDRRIKLQDILPNQLPKFILEESPLTSDFLKQYYISQEFQGGPIDLADNLDQYLNVDNLTPDVITDSTTTVGITTVGDEIINVTSTKGFPNEYGLLKINDEIITYSGITTNKFTGCKRGFSGITSYHQDLKHEELVFSESTADEHATNTSIQNLSSLFLKEFYKKTKYTFTPGLENTNFTNELNVGNFIKESRSLYQAKGTDESFRILFNVLYDHAPTVVNLEDYLIKPSSANYVRRQVAIAEVISGDPLKLKGQSLFRSNLNKDINASVSEVESFTRNNKQYFKFSLFLGYDNYSDLEDDFIIIPTTKSFEKVSIGSSIISVDSTIGFGATGTILSGSNTITYTDKSVNQFLNCSGVVAEISPEDNIRNNETYFGYEEGDINKKVELIFSGVISEFTQKGSIDIDEGDLISVKNIGYNIHNPVKDKTYKQIFSNSWIYNTSSSYKIKSWGNQSEGTLTVESPIDRSSLKYGDKVEILLSDTNQIVYPLENDDIPYVSEEIDNGSKVVSLENFSDFNPNNNQDYKLRRKLNKANASSSSAQLIFGNNNIISDIQNVYFDDEYGYITSNSLPSYHINSGTNAKFPYLKEIDINLKKSVINLSSGIGQLSDLNSDEEYSSIIFDEDIPFITGDRIYYEPSANSLVGLETGTYSVEKIDATKIKIYGSNSGIGGTSRFITFTAPATNDGTHTFTLYEHKDKLIGDQKLFKKFPLKSKINIGSATTTNTGGIGVLINGVEISNYKSKNKVYYGNLTGVDVLNGGENFDVINLPKLTISNPNPISGSGTTALIQPVLSGNIQNIFVDQQDFDIERIISIGVTGGNGSGCLLEPILTKRFREVSFNARTGINTVLNTVLFENDHRFVSGQNVIYDSNFNNGIGYGNTTLMNNATYIAQKINNKTIKLYNNSSDYSSGTNPIDFNGENLSGTHGFKVGPKNTLSSINILNPGENYTNRKLIVKPTGISTIFDTITFPNHGFESGELIEYSGNISGLTTHSQYYTIKKDSDSFRLANAWTVGSVYEDHKLKLLNGELGRNITKFNNSPELINNGEFSNADGWTVGTGWSISAGIATHTGSAAGYLTSTPLTPFIEGKWYILTADVISGVSFPYQAGFGVVNHHEKGYEQGTGSQFVDVYTEKVGNKLIALWRQSSINLNSVNLYSSGGNNNPSIDNVSIREVTTFAKTTTNYTRKKYVSLTSTGTGYQEFSYPKIEASVSFVSVGIGTTSAVSTIEITPTVRGSIKQVYLYEQGTGYGSTIIDFEKKPVISLSNGQGANINPIIVNGKINSINLQYGGKDYFTEPDLSIIDPTNVGNGAKLRPVIEDGKIVDVKISNPGIGYSTSSYIIIKPLGSGEILNSHVRSFTIDKNKKLGKNLLVGGKNKLKYSVCGYSTDFLDSKKGVSDIIGWAYDGNPIYGPIGYKNSDKTGDIVTLQSGYGNLKFIDSDRESLGTISPFTLGYFIEDQQYDNSGDLDEFNGRYEINQDFPNGVYAYHALVDSKDNPVFPYFIGNKYRSTPIEDNFLDIDQSFDFNSSDLVRNTFPYKVDDQYADNDFLVETNEIVDQRIEVESVSRGSVDGFDIVSAGSSFKVNDQLKFDNTGTFGEGLNVSVKSLDGVPIESIKTSTEEYDDSILTWFDDKIKVSILPSHNLYNNDYVVLSGLTTDINRLNSSYKIGFTSHSTRTANDIPVAADTTVNSGIATDIFVYNIPDSVSVGSNISAGTETLEILQIFRNQNILRVSRGSTGVAHTAGSLISYNPDSFTVPNNNIEYFSSKLNDKVYFNPLYSVGIGTTAGSSISTSFLFAGNTITRNILTKRIYLENHPFIDNQKINLTVPVGFGNISISTESDSPTFILPTTVYAVKTSHNTIGIKTGIGTTGGNEVYFRSISGIANNDLYSFESVFDQVSGKIERIKSLVSTSSTHGLVDGDIISLNIKPNLYSGIGTNSSSVSVVRQSDTGFIIIDPIPFTSGSVKNNKLGLGNHGFKTGDKVFYDGDATGLSTGYYYVYKEDDDFIKLGDTYVDVTSYNPTYKSITETTGGSNQKIYKVNPQIEVFKNNNLVFDVSDSSLSGYDLKFYYDSDFKNEFNSVGLSTQLNVVSTGSTVTISYGSSLPIKLYYNLEQNSSGYISTSDTDVNNHSEIIFVDSLYNNDHVISGVGTTSFSLYLKENPERISYGQTECDTLKYSTRSLSAIGPIDKLSILSSGTGYKSLPSYVGSSSTISKDALIIPKSTSIGNIDKIRFINEGFEYSSDKTLQPQASISPIIILENANTIGFVTVTSGGSGYIVPPDIIILDTNTGNKIDSGYLEAELNANSIGKINIQESPSGIPELGTKLIAINNTNGISVEQVIKTAVGTAFTCQITTPTLNFSVPPFKIGDEVFVEGIQSVDGDDGTGFNSEDYGYEFFKVVDIPSINPFKVKLDLVGLTTNVGVAKTIQDSYGTVINKNNYPSFDVYTRNSEFAPGERIISNDTERDLFVVSYSNNILKVKGSYSLSVGEEFVGKITRNTGKVTRIKENIGVYKVDLTVKKDIGWFDDIGKLSIDSQVTSNNDYYQNLSYSIKSPIQWNELQSPVNNILHPSGMKNFSDTGITSTASVGIGSSSVTTLVYDVIEEVNVDTIKDLDLARDTDFLETDSKYVEFKTIRLTDYIECKTNNVLTIDSIDKQFSNLEGEPSQYLNILEFTSNNVYDNYIIKIISNGNPTVQLQLSEIIVMSIPDEVSSTNKFGISNLLFNKTELINSGIGFTTYLEDEIGNFAIVDDKGISYLRFIPNDPFNIDYDLKIIKSSYNTSLSGVGTNSIGPIDLTSGIYNVDASSTSTIISVEADKIGSLLVNSQVIDNVTNNINFVESYITHDGTDTYVSEYFVDSTLSNDGQIGNFSANLSDNTFSLSYTSSTNPVKIKSKIVGFGTTGITNGEFRFKAPLQDDGGERSLIYQGISTSGVGTTTIIGLSTNLFDGFNSIVQVSAGSSKAIHNLIGVQEGTDLYLQQSHYLSIGDDDQPTGLGTFGLSYNGSNFDLKFYPDDMTADTSLVSFNQSLYTLMDADNTYGDYTYGRVTDSMNVILYNAINGNRINRTDFNVNHNSIPIFSKSFNPSSTEILDLNTGSFTIKDHFFRTGEELIYTPDSTFAGVGATPMMYESNSTGIGTLSSSVFAIRKTDDTFEIATTRALANAGTSVTFTSVGEGNAHRFSMSKRNEKTIVTIDGITQYPLLPTSVSHTLEYNEGGQISASSTIFSLSGIATVNIGNVLKIDDEYFGITNVGLGTTTVGPITPGIGTYPIVNVERGFVGSIATTHTNSTAAKLFRGNFNIVDSTIHFTDAPRGNPQGQEQLTGLPFVRSKFTGRVFLRDDYSSNIIYDDFSDQFTGLKTDFILTVGGANTVGIGTSGGNGMLFINSIFQTPTTDNNPTNNFKIIEDASAGVSTVIFSGITSTDGSLVESDFDINQNQLPRGGVIISLGSTPGLGYAPLIGANVNAIVDGTGSITGVVGVGTTGSSLSISTASYDNITGIMTITTSTPHDLVFGDKSTTEVRLVGLEFTCSSSYAGVTTTIFPETDNNTYSVIGVPSLDSLVMNVGVSTIVHGYMGQGKAFAFYGDLNFGSGYNNIVSIGVTVKDEGYEHKYVSHVNDSITVNANSIGVDSKINPTDVTYDPVTGKLVLTNLSHNKITYTEHKAGAGSTYNGSVGIMTVALTAVPSQALADDQLVLIEDESFVFTCGKDDHATEHKYPRPSDPISGKWVPISNVTGGDTFEINVLNVVPSTNTSEHLFVSANSNGIKRSRNTISIPDNAFTFTCSKDYHITEHTYPRSTDPISVGGGSTIISEATSNSITINVGKNIGTGAVITANPVGFNTHEFVSATSDSLEIINCVDNPSLNGTNLQPTTGTLYNPQTGLLTVYVSSHGIRENDTVKFKDNSVIFRCAQDNYQTDHAYPRSTDPASNINVSLGSTTINTFILDVGTSTYGSGGSLEYKITNGGTNYKRPKIYTSSPSYDNLQVRGISRLGIGDTTDTGVGLLVDVEVTPAIEQNEFFTHMFVSADDNCILTGGTDLTPNDVDYDPETGILTLGFASPHNLSNSDNIQIAANSISFKCSKDDYITVHEYPRTTDPAYNTNLSVTVSSTTVFTVSVGKQFTGPVGLGSELFQVSDFKVSRNGYSFLTGDVFEPVGLVTDRRLSSVLSKFQIESTQVYSDLVAVFQFGELDYIDSIKKYQDGSRTRFPLFYNGDLVSVEDADDFDTNLSSVMVVMRNGVLQEPEEAYYFIGGTSINFTVPPRGTTVDEDGNERSGDNIAIFFYKGTDNTDSAIVSPTKSGLETGDIIQLRQNPIEDNSIEQEERTIHAITQSDTVSTNIYRGPGIITATQNVYKPLAFTKQKQDLILDSEIVYKTRLKLEPQIYPTAKIIGYASTSDNYFFVDDVSLFNYESAASPNFGALIVSGIDPVSAAATATIDSGTGQVTGFTVNPVGSGYTTSATVSITAPPIILDDQLVGVGITATATATVSGGSISGITLTNPGLGYTIPPNVLISVPEPVYENVTTAPAASLTIQGNSGIVTGITTTMFGSDLAIEITGITTEGPSFPLMVVGNPLYVYDTEVGHGLTSMDTTGTIEVGIGTTFADNIYTIAAFHQTGVAPNEVTGIITCIIKSDTNTSGLHTMGIGTMPVGKYSSGKISGFTRSSNPISMGVSGYTINSGLTTFPTLQRRSGGDSLEETGAIDSKI